MREITVAIGQYSHRSQDGGATWVKSLRKIPDKHTPVVRGTVDLSCLSWPVEEFTSLELSQSAAVVLSWEDPWIYEGARSHAIYSRDHRESWRYHGLGHTNAFLTADGSERLLALNDGFFLESVDGGAQWSRREFTVEWPPGHPHKKVNLLRHLKFVEPDGGFALVVHWYCGTDFAPVHVGLLHSTDGGTHWRHVHVFDGPDVGDVNERHILTLDVR